MKKRGLISLMVFAMLISIGFASAEICSLSVSLINQDPYPAIPGEYVDVVFQMTGVNNPECGEISLEFIPTFPFSLDQGAAKKVIQGNTYIQNYNKNWMIPYTLTIDPDALDGASEVVMDYFSPSIDSHITKRFNIEIEDSRANFEINVKDYSYSTKELTFEILNIEDVNVEALAIEIPKQNNIDVRGSNRVLVGDLDSNEYTSANFLADVTEGEIKVNVVYTDQIGVRRTIEKTVKYDPVYFKAREGDQKSTPIGYYIVLIVVVVLIVLWVVRKKKKKKERLAKRRGMAKL